MNSSVVMSALAFLLSCQLLTHSWASNPVSSILSQQTSPACPSPPPQPPPASTPASNQPPQPMHSYSHYTLSLQWPYTTCFHPSQQTTNVNTIVRNKNCQVAPAAFTVSSFWASNDPPNPSSTCCIDLSDNEQNNDDQSNYFSLSPILDLTPALRRFWPNLIQGSGRDEIQWRYNWLKYGTCTDLSERSYFRRVLQLARQYDFIRVLKASGIHISNNRHYSIFNVQSAADIAVGGHQVRLICRIDFNDNQFIPYLHNIHVCFHPITFHVVDCPNLSYISKIDFRNHIPNSDSSCHTFSHLIIPYGPSSTNSNSNSHNNYTQPYPNNNLNNNNSNSNNDNHNNTQNNNDNNPFTSDDNSNRNDSNNNGPSNFNSSRRNEEMTFLDAALYITTSLAIFVAIAFCIFYQFRYTVQPSRHDRPSRTYYHPIHTSANTNP